MLTDDHAGEAAMLESARESVARERLEELQALARTYRQWSVKELAHALGRQPGRLVPDSGMPKLDLVVGLARALDWPVEAVVDHIMRPGSEARAPASRDAAGDFAGLYNDSLAKRAVRDFIEAIRLAVRAHAAADTPTRRAAALYIESLAHEAAGSYNEAVRCLRAAAAKEGVALDWRLLADAQLANMLFMQGQQTHALGIAASVLEYGSAGEQTHTLRLAQAIARWSRGHALRASIPLAHFDAWTGLAASARADFAEAERIAADLATCPAISPERNLTFAACIESAALELDAIIGTLSADAAIDRLAAIVREHGDLRPSVGERKAWAAVALAATTKRFVGDDIRRRGLLEIASGALRAHAVATSNWYFAHRHLELDAERRRTLGGTGVPSRALDATEAKLVAGILGQIPAARPAAEQYFTLYAGFGDGGAA
ncbi:MAG: hypothetical protein ACKO0W_06990 [Planctomycetota bacterium]